MHKNIDFDRMPYSRGFVFALYMNCRLSNSTDNFLFSLLNDKKDSSFSNKKFVEFFEKGSNYIPDIKDVFNKYIEQGQTIPLDICQNLLPLTKKIITQNKKKCVFYHLNNEEQQIKRFFNIN